LSVNPFKYLEELEFRPMGGDSSLSKTTLDIIFNNIQSLRVIRGLSYWSSLSDKDHERLSSWIRENNLDLHIQDVVPIDYSIFTGGKIELSDEHIQYYSTA